MTQHRLPRRLVAVLLAGSLLGARPAPTTTAARRRRRPPRRRRPAARARRRRPPSAAATTYADLAFAAYADVTTEAEALQAAIDDVRRRPRPRTPSPPPSRPGSTPGCCTAPRRPSASTMARSTTPRTGRRARSTPGRSTRPTSTTSRATPPPASSTTPPACRRSPPTSSWRPTRRAASRTSPPAGTPSSSSCGARTSAPTAPAPAPSPTTRPRPRPSAGPPTSRCSPSCWSTTSSGVRDQWDPEDGAYRETFLADPDQAVANIFRSMGALSQGELAGERIAVAYDTKDQEDEHSCFSDNTTIDIAGNAIGVRMIYLADYPGHRRHVALRGGGRGRARARRRPARPARRQRRQGARPSRPRSTSSSSARTTPPGRVALLELITGLQDQGDSVAELAGSPRLLDQPGHLGRPCGGRPSCS